MNIHLISSSLALSSLLIGPFCFGQGLPAAPENAPQIKMNLNSGWVRLPAKMKTDCGGRVRFFSSQEGQSYIEVQGSVCHEIQISTLGELEAEKTESGHFPLSYLAEDSERLDGYGSVIQIDGNLTMNVMLSNLDDRSVELQLTDSALRL